MKKHISLIISILCISAMANAAGPYFVDFSKANDNGDGLGWATAKQTILAASTLAASGENIYIKGGTFTTSTAMVFKAGVNYYGSCDAANTLVATTRSLSDMDGNGVIEPWEFSNPTLLSSTNNSTSGTAGVFNFASLCSIDGFVFTSTYSGGTYVRVFTQDASPNNIYTFRNNIIRNCNISNSTGGASAGFLTLTGTSTNCLIENNRFNVTTTATFNNNTNRGLVVVGSGANVSNFVIRNNNLNYNLSTVKAGMTSNSSTMGFIVQLAGGGATVVKNLIVNNNEIYFTGSATLPTATRGAILSFGSTTATDYILNCTVANNKTTNLSCAGISFNSAIIQAYNNVAFNNYNGGSLSNMVIPTAITSAGLVSKNFTNGAGITNATYATNNDNTQTATDNSSFKFINPTIYNGLPTSYSGNPVGKAAATSLWSIASDSYLVAKGITNLNIVNDKNGNAFAATPAVGAYEAQTNYFVDFSKADDSGAGTSWETAKKTIAAASALSKAYDNIYIKGGTFTTGALVTFVANRYYYGSCDASNTGTTTTRAVSDLDANGIVESWELSNPTQIFSTFYGSPAITVAASIVDGFDFKYTINSSAASAPRFLVFSNAPIFRNNSIQNCNITYANGTGLSGATFQVLMNPLGTFSNNLVQNNNLTFNATSDYNGGTAYPFLYLSGVSASGCIVRNNKVTLNCALATSVSNNLYPFVTISKHSALKTVLKNSIIHNNEVAYTGSLSYPTFPNCGAITLYAAGVTDSILNCTVANNKMTNAATTAGINFNFQNTTKGIQAYNNVAWNNYNGSTLTNYNSVAEVTMGTGTQIKNNFSNGAGLTNGTKITGSDNTQTATDNTQFLFATPTTAAGNTTDLTSEKSVWSLTSGSYLIAKGITSSNNYDKAGNSFGATPAVGAYEYKNIIINSTTNWSDLPSANAGTDILVSSGELILNSNAAINKVTVAPGAKLTLGSNTLTATNGITLESNTDATATILDSYSTPTLIATVQQHVSAGRNWYLSSPVSAAPYTWLSRGTSVQGWNEATKAWVPVTEGALVRGKGYVQVATTIVSPASTTGTTGTVNVTGTTNSGDVAITVSRTESSSSCGFNLVGNPYPSYLKWTGVNGFLAEATNDSISTSFWYRTKNSSDAYVFTTYNGSSHLVVGGTTLNNNALNEFIPPMQAFWIRVDANTAVSTHNVRLTFKNNMRFHGVGDNNKFKAPKADERQLVRLQLANGNQSDEALLYFDAAAANSFDNYDSPKMMNNSATLPDLYTTVGTERLVINGMNAIADNMELPLGFTLKAAATGLKLKVSELSNFASGTKVYLLDKEQHAQTELLPTTEYTFDTSVSTTNNENRFALLFRAPSVTTGIDNAEYANIKVYVNANRQIVIDAQAGNNYAIYNALGQIIENGKTISNFQTSNVKLSNGVYLVKVANQSNRVIIK